MTGDCFRKRVTWIVVLSIFLLVFAAFAAAENAGTESPPSEQPQEPPPHVHSYGEPYQAKAPTCIEEGRLEQKCDCGDVKAAGTIPKLEHNYISEKYHDATCDESSYVERTCGSCGITFRSSTGTPAIGKHEYKVVGSKNVCQTCTVCGLNFEHWMDPQTLEPTCTTDGWRTYKCRVCGYATGEYETYKALGHRFSYGTWTDKYCAVCTNKGCKEGILHQFGASYENGGKLCSECVLCGLEVELKQKDVPLPTVAPTSGGAKVVTNTAIKETPPMLQTHQNIVVHDDGALVESSIEALLTEEGTRILCITAQSEADGTYAPCMLMITPELIAEAEEAGYSAISFAFEKAIIVIPLDVLKAEETRAVVENAGLNADEVLFMISVASDEEGTEVKPGYRYLIKLLITANDESTVIDDTDDISYLVRAEETDVTDQLAQLLHITAQQD